MRLTFSAWVLAAASAALVACSDGGAPKKPVQTPAAAAAGPAPAGPATSNAPPTPPIPPPVAAAAAVSTNPPAAASLGSETSAPPAEPDDPQAQAINTAGPTGAKTSAWSPVLVRAQVLLARARFSPGVIDGRDGDNFKNALGAFERTHGYPADGQLDPDVWAALTGGDPGPAVTSYVISAADVAGPFSPPAPRDDLLALSQFDHLGYTGPAEMLAERFHMDEGLLKALNPTANFGVAGAKILVAALASPPPPMTVALIEVDKTARQVRAFDAKGTLLATYPATVGSTERPAPTGRFKVTGIAHDPTYTYDPKRLTYGDRSLGKLTIKPGPNNPVGVVWIDLSIPTYGIHGAPDPKLVGKVASHGCVRLTNWDATDLAAGVKAGVKVVFVGADTPASSQKPRARRG